VTSVGHECGQWRDERTAFINDVSESEHVDHNGHICKKMQFIHAVNGDGSKTAKS